MASRGSGGRFLLFVLMAAFLPGAVRGFVWSVERVLGRSDLLWPLAVGFVLGVLVDERLIGRAPGAETFEHELTHALVALLFLRRVTRFVVTKRNGGWVQYSGGFGGVVADDLIGLAPYVLPTFTALSVAARPALDAGWFPWFDVWIGPTLGYHTWNTIRGTRRAWTSRPFVRAGTEEMVQLSRDIQFPAVRGHPVSRMGPRPYDAPPCGSECAAPTPPSPPQRETQGNDLHSPTG